MAWIGICFGIFNTCGSLRLNRIGKNKEINEEYDKDLVEEEFQLATVKFGRNGEGSRENSLYFKKDFPMILVSDISNTSIFNVCDVLQWIDLLVIKTFFNIFRSIFCWGK